MFSTFESHDELGDLIIDRTEGWYDAKHSSFSSPEIEFVNSIKVTCCPYCGSNRFRKIGHRKAIAKENEETGSSYKAGFPYDR